MKLFELYNPNMRRDSFDLHDDLIFFMRNDPQFYRKDYYPFLKKFNSHCDAGRSVSAKAFVPIVKHAFECYKNSFPIEGLEESLSDTDLKEICEKLSGEEKQFYENEKNKTAEKKHEIKRTV